MIKKFKNGNINIHMREDLEANIYELGNGFHSDVRQLERFYHNDMNQADLYYHELEGNPYFLDYNTRLAYAVPHCHFFMFLENLGKGKTYKLESLGKRESERLFALTE